MKSNSTKTEIVVTASCPARGTWIEIRLAEGDVLAELVVPRKGHVD